MRDHEDDEYAWAGVEDPKLVITTSHDPSSRLKQFCKVRPDGLSELSWFLTKLYVMILNFCAFLWDGARHLRAKYRGLCLGATSKLLRFCLD